MLGLVHRALLGKGPQVLHTFFKKDAAPPSRASGRLNTNLDADSNRCYEGILPINAPNYAQRSGLGMPRIYNMLPADIRRIDNVASFQGALQELLCLQARAGNPLWDRLFSCRLPRNNHPHRSAGRIL